MFFNLWHKMIGFITFEFILTKLKKSNGGSVIALRSLLTALILFTFVLFLINIIDPKRICEFNLYELRIQIIEKITWFGVIFATVYAALYARFSSQWTYLANLYNQIKQTETGNNINDDKLAEWKAGFIEDAQELHLLSKSIFASVVYVWGKDYLVKIKFNENTPGGKSRYDQIMETVNKICDEECKKYNKE